jgi:hypothetical protein
LFDIDCLLCVLHHVNNHKTLVYKFICQSFDIKRKKEGKLIGEGRL